MHNNQLIHNGIYFSFIYYGIEISYQPLNFDLKTFVAKFLLSLLAQKL